MAFLIFIQVVGLPEPPLARVADLSVDVDVDVGIGRRPPHSPSEHMNLI